MNPEQKRRAEQFTSIFENDTTELQYGYAKDIQDHRGITAGRAGFTTRDGDALDVVRRYTEKQPENPLAGFVSELVRLADEQSDDTSGLEGYLEAWSKAAKDPVFCDVQDQVSDELYYLPSQAAARESGIATALAEAVLYDTAIQHGLGQDDEGLPAMLRRASDESGGTPGTGIDEKAWLDVFLRIRREVLAANDVWRDSVDRVDAFRQIARDGNYNLNGPIHVLTDQHDKTIL